VEEEEAEFRCFMANEKCIPHFRIRISYHRDTESQPKAKQDEKIWRNDPEDLGRNLPLGLDELSTREELNPRLSKGKGISARSHGSDRKPARVFVGDEPMFLKGSRKNSIDDLGNTGVGEHFIRRCRSTC